MIYDSFVDFSEVLHIATKFGRTRSKLSKVVKTLSGGSGNGRFTVGAPTASNFTQSLPKVYPKFVQNLFNRRTSIKQIRVLVAFILQPEMKLPKIVPDPEQ